MVDCRRNSINTGLILLIENHESVINVPPPDDGIDDASSAIDAAMKP